jgi:5-deoxy-D-glucuronate isomerase
MFCDNKKVILPNLKAYFKKNNLVNFITLDENIKIKILNYNFIEVLYKNKQQKKFIKLKNFKTKLIGKGNSRRKVTHFLYPKNNQFKLRVGITQHLGRGTWSSLPHGFEKNLEKGFEEIFFYILKGSTKSAVQVGKGVWHNMIPINSCWLVKNKMFSPIPMGFHPVVGEPGVSVKYLWAYICKHKRWEKI